MKPALNQDNNPDILLNKFSFIGKIFFGLKTGGRVYQVLLAGVGTLVIAGGVFFSLKWYENRQRKVFAATAAFQVELPKGIDKKDLPNLTAEQKKKLDNQINNVLSTNNQKVKLPEKSRQAVVIVLTQNGQPILPDSERGTGGTSQEAAPTATSPPSARGELTPTLTPTPIPCTDTDGGKDIFTKGTLTTSYGDKKTDFCTDPTIIGEYYCVPDASFAFGGFECPGNCVDSACLRATPTPAASQPSPRPTYAPCVDTDGGIELYKYGEITWNNQTDKDSCYSASEAKYLSACSGSGCYLMEGYCEDKLPVREIFRCDNGCGNGVCLPKSDSTPTPSSIPPTKGPTATLPPEVTPTPTSTPENNLTFVLDPALEQKYQQVNKRKLKDDVNKIYEAIKRLYGPPYRNTTVQIKLSEHSYYNLSLNEIGIAEYHLESPGLLIEEILMAFHDVLIAFIPGTWEAGFRFVVGTEVNVELFMTERKNQARFYYPLYEIVAPNPGWVSQGGNFLAINDFLAAEPHTLLYATLYKPFIEDNQFFVNFNHELYKLPVNDNLFYKMPMILGMVKPEIEGEYFGDWFENQYILQILPLPGKFIIPYLEKDQAGKMVIYAKAVEVLENGDRVEAGGKSMTIHAYRPGDMEELWSTQRPTQDLEGVNFGEMPSRLVQYGNILFEIKIPGFESASFYYPYWEFEPLVIDSNPANGVFGSLINAKGGQLDLEIPHNKVSKILSDDGVFDTRYTPPFHDFKGTVTLSYFNRVGDQTPVTVKKITKDRGDYYTFFRFAKAATSQTRGLPPAPTGNEDIVDGMKLFISEKLGFKIRYPAELFAWEWKSDEQPNFNSEKPDFDKNVVQFFKNADLYGAKITINRYTNPQRKTAKDFAKAYWSASEESLKHWKPKDIDFVVHTVKVQGEGEEKSYLTPLGDWMYIFGASDASLQSALEKMLPTLEFTGTGEALSESLTPCPDDLLSTAEQLNKAQENWWEKPDECNNRPEQKVCGYIRSIYDNGIVQVGSQNYRNLYCYCSFFEKDGSRTFRGTGMFSLGYEEGACVK